MSLSPPTLQHNRSRGVASQCCRDSFDNSVKQLLCVPDHSVSVQFCTISGVAMRVILKAASFNVELSPEQKLLHLLIGLLKG